MCFPHGLGRNCREWLVCIRDDRSGPKEAKPTLRDLAKKHGIDLSRIADNQEEIDLITGKRIFLD